MDENTYIKDRVQDQLQWFEKKSKENQDKYKRLKTVVIILSVSIPVLTNFVDMGNGEIKYVIALVGLLIASIEGILSLYKYQDNWLQYRASAEALRREQFLYETKSGAYQQEQTESSFNNFVVRIEEILGQDVSNWKAYTKKSSSS